jgi:hypothetical protein
MKRNGLVVSFGLAAGLAAALSAQVPSSNGNADRKTIQSIRVKVIGCVAGGSEAGHYRLTNAFLRGDDVPSTTGTVGRAGSGQDLSFENSPSFDLIGGDLKAHMGHEVEVIGITSDMKLNKRASFSAAIGSSTQEKATLTVSSVTMIAATCP